MNWDAVANLAIGLSVVVLVALIIDFLCECWKQK